MKIFQTSLKLGATILALSSFMVFTVHLPKAQAAVKNWQKGVSLYPQANNDFAKSSFQLSLKNAAAIGANMATFIVPYYQKYENSADIQPGWNTPTDSSLIDGINFAHSLGLATTIKIHLSPYYGNSWAAYINPADRGLWFANYGNLLAHYANLSAQQKSEQFIIGNELTILSSAQINPDNTIEWQKLIALVRARYNGKVLYNANWGDEVSQIDFWNNLDAIGISAYFTLDADLNNSWQQWNASIVQPLAQHFSKPVLFTEVGYRSVDGAAAQPWNFAVPGNVNLQEQSRDYDQLFNYWNNFDYVQGINLWNWETNPYAGGTNDNSYTVQNKPAQEIISKWFKGF